MSISSTVLNSYNKINVSRIILYLIIFLLPLNLGYHFVVREAYVKGLLIDYLTPTLYVQDILVLLLVLINLKKIKIGKYSYDKYLVWFLFSVLLSTFISEFFLSSFLSFFRLFVYTLMMLYMRSSIDLKKHAVTITRVFGVSVLLISILSFMQWFKQGSIFDNYLFFGEQPYTISTPGINVENFLGAAKVPPYATFRHPNILGGFLSIILIWFLFHLKESFLFKILFVTGLVVLFLTLAKFAWISFGLGLAGFLLYTKKNTHWKKIVLGFIFIFLIISFALPTFRNVKSLKEHPSYYRRAHLVEASYSLIKKYPLFGVGFNSSTAYIDEYLPPKNDIRFAQPPHNIFLLLASESGIIALLFFMFFYTSKLRKAKEEPVIFISLIQILFLGSFDHYFFTMHQTLLLMWLILGFV